MRDRLRLPLRFDAEAMRRDVEGLPENDWIAHFVKDNYEGVWDAVPLRASATARHPVEMIYSDPSSSAFVDTPLLARCPHLQSVLAAFHCPLEAVRLMRLRPGAAIHPHTDHDLAPELGRARLHIPIATNPEVEFHLAGEPVVMNEGECWYLRLADTHSVVNRGHTDRVHLVIDAVVNPWLESLLDEADRSAAAETATAAPLSDLDAFRALVSEDASLQQQLTAVDDQREFIALAIRVAADHGYAITANEIDRAMRETRRSWRERFA